MLFQFGVAVKNGGFRFFERERERERNALMGLLFIVFQNPKI
jgi:hypothetical protein